jgi:hypothetical protein
MKGYRPLIILLILFNVSITSAKAQSQEDPHLYLGIGINHFFKVQDNMKAFLYSASFADMKDLNEFDLGFSIISPALNLCASIPINEYLDYDFFFSRNYLKTNIEYENLNNQIVSRHLKLRTSSFGILGIRYKLNQKASFGFNFPLVTAKLLYKSKNIESESSKL